MLKRGLVFLYQHCELFTGAGRYSVRFLEFHDA